MRSNACILLSLIIVAASLSAYSSETDRTRHVALSGDDSNPGTEMEPWRSLEKASAAALPGDTVLVHEGTYNERLIPAVSGIASKPITFAAYPGSKVTLDGTGINLDKWWGIVQISDRDYIRIQGFEIVNSTGAGVNAGESRNIIVDDCVVYDSYQSGIIMRGCANVEITDNELVSCSAFDNGTPQGSGVQENISLSDTDGFLIAGNHIHHGENEGIDVKDGSRNGIVRDNTVHHQTHVGIYMGEADGDLRDIEVYHNTVHDSVGGFAVAVEAGGTARNIRLYENYAFGNKGAGFTVAGWADPETTHDLSDIDVTRNRAFGNETGLQVVGIPNSSLDRIAFSNNLVVGNINAGMRILSAGLGSDETTIRGLRIVNNTFVANGGSGVWGAGGIVGWDLKISDLTIRNNILIRNSVVSISLAGPKGAKLDKSQIHFDKNMIDEVGSAPRHGWPVPTPGSYIRVPAETKVFVDLASEDFRLADTSPAIDAGDPSLAPDVDFDAAPRPRGARIDIGAYEHP